MGEEVYPPGQPIVCRVDGCGLTREQHKGKVHPFSPEGMKFSRQKDGGVKKGSAPLAEEPEVRESTLPFDPVLRALLIDKGLISFEELTEVERLLNTQALIDWATP